ncbi:MULTISPECIES: LacI family DNA-binding transcriptional regulator [unclassified Devosia]|jgi:DNA-binding LacI/PurR family transcriptional regulator|uniref:LacI family DNA-binding transcriptional regulator n=1 Tax=unclassified Devosia TaxID=196773 RepID=UPI00095FD595|nr:MULTISPECIES: LacI family DNA-binding transcriptional regulator [unclassified Devosia]MBN9364622.1 LacI family DNA-binding transcriptional regulator [Devosia sp.]OJX25497.1 MAG: LacI family transcriptional regulator [Devosia sp. 66-14]
MSTISKVAERAGVSRTTVSHVINHANRVSKPLREKVQAAIDELGYSPNPQAKSLRTGRTNLIAMLIPDIGNPFYTEMVKAAQAALEEAGLDALIYNTDVPGGNWQTHGRDYLRQLSRKRVDGLLVGDFALHGITEELLKLDTPTVFIGHLANQAVDSVKIDDFGGGYMVGEHLARQGHKHVVQVTGPELFESAMARADGFEQALKDNKIRFSRKQRYLGSYLPPSGREAAQWIATLSGDDRPSAVFVGNYLMAMGLLAEFHDQGVRVPKDIAVAIFGDLPQLEYVRPNLTRAGENPGALARRAVEMLLDRLNGKFDGPPRTEVIPCALRIFESA